MERRFYIIEQPGKKLEDIKVLGWEISPEAAFFKKRALKESNPTKCFIVLMDVCD